MPIRTGQIRAGRLALAAALAWLCVGAFGVPARAATSVEIDVRPLVGGRYEVGGWAALSVTLVNQGPPTEGLLSAETENGTAGRRVDLPAGARKVVTLYVRPGAFQTQISVAYTDAGGTAATDVDVRVIEPTSGQVAVVGDSSGALRQQLSGSSDDSRPEVISLASADLPERPEPLSGLATIAWAGDATALTSGQLDSLAHWVAHGGRLVVVAGPDWQARTAGLEALLPVTALSAIDDTELAPLDAWVASESPGLETATVASGPLAADARTIVANDEGTLLLSMRPEGAGQVVLVGADLAGDDLGRWDGASRFWDRVAPATGMVDQFFGPGVNSEMDSAMRGALSVLPTLAVPPAELLLGVIVAYILLIGPISYVVLRRWDRREMAWVTAPILIVTFTACSFGIGRTIKGTDIVVNQVAIVRATPSGAALVETFAGVFSPDRSTYDLAVDADALLTTLPDEFGDGTFRAAAGTTIEQGRPAQIRGLSIASFGFAGVRSSALADVEPALAVTWSVHDATAVGTVTNTSDETLTDVAIIGPAGGERIGDLAPRASAEFTLNPRNINGSSASDQVYGFGGFQNETEAQRRVALRREVINALVGYGGWADMEIVPSFGNGPYIIGWRDGEGPVPVEVAGRATQRLTSIVEVLPIQPGIGTGQVRIGPSRMSVSVAAMEGDVVGGFDAGSIIVNDGSVTFSIALPLEASGLDASDVEIIVGPDASVMVGGQGDFQGFWPPGFTLEVRDPATGSWTTLGDLADASTFTIDEPDTVLGPTGLIAVRVSGATDPVFGQNSVFVSAEVTGVLAP